MKTRTRAHVYLSAAAALAVFSGLALVNNLSAVFRWWGEFSGNGGDATLIPDKCPGIIPWLDWTAVDYSCVTTFIPFLGFFLIARGLQKALAGKYQDPESFPFFKAYDQLNISLGLIGTLWGIIIIGYFKMDTVSMGDLMMCLHTALFSTLMAVVWVFIVDHSVLRPMVLSVLRGLQGSEHEEEELIDLIDKLSSGAAGLCEVWDGNRERLTVLNDSISLASAELKAFGGVGKNVSDILTHELTLAAQNFITKLTGAANELEAREGRMEAAFAAREEKFAASQASFAALLQTVAASVSGMQKLQESFASAAEKLASENAGLLNGISAERSASNALRGKVSELQGESEGRMKHIEALLERIRGNEAAFNERLEKLRGEVDAIATEKAKLEGEKQSALRDSEASLHRAEKAETLLAKIKSAFNV